MTNTPCTPVTTCSIDIEPDRTMARKDEDELALAVTQGRYDAATAAAIEADAAEAETVVADWGPPFCDGWEHFRPHPAWPIPGLPDCPQGVSAWTSVHTAAAPEA